MDLDGVEMIVCPTMKVHNSRWHAMNAFLAFEESSILDANGLSIGTNIITLSELDYVLTGDQQKKYPDDEFRYQRQIYVTMPERGVNQARSNNWYTVQDMAVPLDDGEPQTLRRRMYEQSVQGELTKFVDTYQK